MNKQLRNTFRLVIVGFAGLSLIALLACSSSGTNTTSIALTTLPTITLPGTNTSTTSPSYTINIASKEVVGSYLVDGSGMTLYYTVSDRPNYSNLPDETLSAWPVFYVTDYRVPSVLNVSDFGFYNRDNNIKQTTYKGYPLYYFYQDKVRGDTLGNKLSGVWFVVNPANFP